MCGRENWLIILPLMLHVMSQVCPSNNNCEHLELLLQTELICITFKNVSAISLIASQLRLQSIIIQYIIPLKTVT